MEVLPGGQRLPALGLAQLVVGAEVLAENRLDEGMEGDVDEGHRIRFFEIATKQLPPRIPVSTILFPMLTGDPGAPGLYWELANATRGALVSPSKSWPDT